MTRLRHLVLAGPMTGMPDFNYPAFDQAAAVLERAGYRVWSPTVLGRSRLGMHAPARVYLRITLGRVLSAEGVALLPGWTDSDGAQAEWAVARAVQVPVRTLSEWLRFARENDPQASL